MKSGILYIYLLCQNSIPKKTPTTTFPMRKFPCVTLLGLWVGSGGCGKVSVGDALQGFEIPEFWEQRQSRNDPDFCLSPMLSAQIPGVCWFSLTISFPLFLWQNTTLDTMDLFHSVSHGERREKNHK